MEINDVERIKVLITQYLFAEEEKRNRDVGAAFTRVKREKPIGYTKEEAAADYIIALSRETQCKLMEQALFDIIKRF